MIQYTLDQLKLPLELMEQVASQRHDEFLNADPCPHIVLEDFFDPEVLDIILSEMPEPEKDVWANSDGDQQRMRQISVEADLPPFTRQYLMCLNSAPFLSFLERLTRIEQLIPDPYFDGGGLHQQLPGGRLAIHTDFNKHRHFSLDRRINAIIYMNKDWKDEYGGHLEFWDPDMRECRQHILPSFNKMVIFNTTDFSLHGIPDPLNCRRE